VLLLLVWLYMLLVLLWGRVVLSSREEGEGEGEGSTRRWIVEVKEGKMGEERSVQREFGKNFEQSVDVMVVRKGGKKIDWELEGATTVEGWDGESKAEKHAF